MHKNSLASCQLVSSQRPTTHPDLSFQTKTSEFLVTVELTPHTYTPQSETSCFSKLFALYRYGNTEQLGLCQLNRFSSTVSVKFHILQIVHMLLMEEYVMSKRWIIIMDKQRDKNEATTSAETSGPSAQKCYCARGSGGDAKKQRGNREE